MLAIQITANVFLLAAIGVSCILSGLMFRQVQLQKRGRQIIELEKEMLRNHAEIIDLHKQLDLFKNHELKTGATILKLKDGTVSEEQNNLPDVSVRKKLLGQASNRK